LREKVACAAGRMRGLSELSEWFGLTYDLEDTGKDMIYADLLVLEP
jgi:hypothetical protein